MERRSDIGRARPRSRGGASLRSAEGRGLRPRALASLARGGQGSNMTMTAATYGILRDAVVPAGPRCSRAWQSGSWIRAPRDDTGVTAASLLLAAGVLARDSAPPLVACRAAGRPPCAGVQPTPGAHGRFDSAIAIVFALAGAGAGAWLGRRMRSRDGTLRSMNHDTAYRADIADFQRQAETLFAAWSAGDSDAQWRAQVGASALPRQGHRLRAGGDTRSRRMRRLVVAHQQSFETWADLWRSDLVAKPGPVATFGGAAVEAVVSGDLADAAVDAP